MSILLNLTQKWKDWRQNSNYFCFTELPARHKTFEGARVPAALWTVERFVRTATSASAATRSPRPAATTRVTQSLRRIARLKKNLKKNLKRLKDTLQYLDEKCVNVLKQTNKKRSVRSLIYFEKNKMAASSSHYQRLCFIPKHRRIIFLFVFHPVNSSFRRLKKNNIKDDELFFCLMSKSLRVVQADGPLWAARNVKWRKFPPQKNGSIYNEYI